MLDYLNKVKDTPKCDAFKNFTYLQLTNFRRMLVAGSDGYYRTEFKEIISQYDEYQPYIAEWDIIIGLRRTFGRALARKQSKKYMYENAEDILKKLIQIWNSISQKEPELIRRMQAQINVLKMVV